MTSKMLENQSILPDFDTLMTPIDEFNQVVIRFGYTYMYIHIDRFILIGVIFHDLFDYLRVFLCLICGLGFNIILCDLSNVI